MNHDNILAKKFKQLKTIVSVLIRCKQTIYTSLIILISLYLACPSTKGKMWYKVILFSRVQPVGIKCLPFCRSVVILMIKILVYPSIFAFSWNEKRWFDAFPDVDLLINFNGISTHLGLFYALWLMNRVHCTSYLQFLHSCILRFFFSFFFFFAHNPIEYE